MVEPAVSNSDVEAVLAARGVEVVWRGESGGWTLRSCPFNASHQGPMIIPLEGSFKYFCEGCGENASWAEFCTRLEKERMRTAVASEGEVAECKSVYRVAAAAQPTQSPETIDGDAERGEEDDSEAAGDGPAISSGAEGTREPATVPTSSPAPNSRATAVHPNSPVPNGSGLRSISALTLYNADLPELPFVIPQLLPVGLTILAGRPKTGKSYLGLEIAIAVGLGSPLMGHFEASAPARVLYCALEEPKRRTKARLKQLIAESHSELKNVEFLYELPATLETGAAALDLYLSQHPVRLLIIDTLLALTRGNDDRNNHDLMQKDYRKMDLLRQLAEKHKLAVLIVHHTRKSEAGYSLDAVAGTTGLTAACDAVWSLRRQAAGKYLLEVTGRELEETTYVLKFSSGDSTGWQVEGGDAGPAIGDEQQRILQTLHQEALTPQELATKLQKNPSTVRSLLQKLVQDNLVTKGSDGKYVSMI